MSSIPFNAYEIFEIAEQIERNGASFYRQAAALMRRKDAKKFLLDLAVMEDEHEDLFQTLKKQFNLAGNQEVPDLDNLTVSYLRAMAGSNVFVTSNSGKKLLKGAENVVDILKVALAFEKDSVIYFNTVKKLVKGKKDKAKIDALVEEEVRHIALLLDKMDEQKKSGKNELLLPR